MQKPSLETLKSYILAVLVISSVALMSSLWSIEARGTLFNFRAQSIVSGIFPWTRGYSTTSDATRYISFFSPNYILITSDAGHKIINQSDKSTERVYQELTQAQFEFLEGLYSKEVVYEGNIDEEAWLGIFEKNTILYDFPSGFSTELIAWIINQYSGKVTKGLQANFAGVKQMVLSPYENVNSNITTVYIKDNAQKNHKFQVSNTRFDKTFFEKQLKVADSAVAIKYNTAYDLKLNISLRDKGIGISPDVIIPFPDLTEQELRFSAVSFFNRFNFESFNEDKLDQFVADILGEQRNNYIVSMSKYNVITLSHVRKEGFFQIYGDGMIEYFTNSNYTPSTDITISDSYKAAINFLYKYEPLSRQYNLFIDSIKLDPKGRVIFRFDYRIHNIPVSAKHSSGRLNHAIKIDVNGNRVERYSSYIRRYEQYPQSSYKKGISIEKFFPLFGKIINYIDKSGLKDVTIDRGYFGYDCNIDTATYPYWYFDLKDSKGQTFTRVNLFGEDN